MRVGEIASVCVRAHACAVAGVWAGRRAGGLAGEQPGGWDGDDSHSWMDVPLCQLMIFTRDAQVLSLSAWLTLRIATAHGTDT